jgi:hypothetical protein
MRSLFIPCFVCVLVVGCASPAPPPKPSPYRYARAAQLSPIQIPQPVWKKEVHRGRWKRTDCMCVGLAACAYFNPKPMKRSRAMCATQMTVIRSVTTECNRHAISATPNGTAQQ